MNLSKQYAVLTVSAATLLLAFNVAAQDYSVVPALGQHAKKTRPDNTPQDIEAVIRQFWDGLGHLDADKMKQSLDWPVTIIESSMTNSKQAIALRNPLEFDEEFKRTPASAVEKGRSEFFGTKLLAFRVEMLGPNLASVTYSYHLPRDLVARDPKSKGGVFNAVTVLRRNPREGNRWRIVFITVPA